MKKGRKTKWGGQAPTNNVCQGGTQINISGNAQFVNGGTGIQVNGPYYAAGEENRSTDDQLQKAPEVKTEKTETPTTDSESHPSADNMEKVLNSHMEHGGEQLNALEQIRKAMALIDPGNRVSLALLLLVCQEAKAVSIDTHPMAFVRLLSSQGLLPNDLVEQKRIAHSMQRTMKDFAGYISYKKWPETNEDYQRKRQKAEQLYRALLNLH